MFTPIININSYQSGQRNAEGEATRTGCKIAPHVVLKPEKTWRKAFRIDSVTGTAQ